MKYLFSIKEHVQSDSSESDKRGPDVIKKDGTKEWWLNGKRHREDGPAVEFPEGGKVWYLNGLKHRTDGPAVVFSDGSCEWYLNGNKYSKSEFIFLTDDRFKSLVDGRSIPSIIEELILDLSDEVGSYYFAPPIVTSRSQSLIKIKFKSEIKNVTLMLRELLDLSSRLNSLDLELKSVIFDNRLEIEIGILS